MDYAINSDAEVYLTTALLYEAGLKGFIKSLIDPLELILWCLLNQISLSRVCFIFRKKALSGKDVLFMMHYGNFTYEANELFVRGERLAEYLSDVNIYKVVHMTHYAYNPSSGANNLRILSPDLLVAENDLLKNSPFFIKYFADLPHSFYHLPYTPSARFVRKKPFKGRLNKIVATGSITFKMKGSEFIEFFGVDELQPLRRTLYENSSKYSAELDSQISDLNASRVNVPKDKMKSLTNRLVKKLLSKHPQLSYYKKDIVAIYNAYTMFTVPEEICNLPAIGFVEGMACGCVFFGLDDPMYRDIGLIPNVHYVAHDGTLPSLISKVRYYQENSDELEKIANQGYEFVTNKINSNTIYKQFFNQIDAVVEFRSS